VYGSIHLDGLEEILRGIVREELAGARQEPSGWLSAKSAGTYLDMSEDAIRACIKRGQLMPHRTVTGGLRFSRAQLDEFAKGDPLP
jgi:hypothetical protein